MPKCYVVLEPHADDAFLSVGSHIERWVKAGDRVHIVTFFPVERTSLRDAENYAVSVGATWTGWTLPGAGEKIPKRPEHAPTWWWGREPDTQFTMENWLGLNDGWGWEVQLILPLGGAPVDQNPHTRDHEDVRKRFEHEGVWYYVDQPYAIIKKHSERFTEKLKDMRTVSYLKPGANKWKRGVPIFKSQAKFFHFNEGNLPKTFEMLVRK